VVTNPNDPHAVTEPVVERPDLPRMDDGDVRQREIKGRIRFMDDGPADTGGGARGLMADIPPEDARESVPSPGEYPPQRPRRATFQAEELDGYLRLLLRVEDGVVSVVDASRVPGPLIQSGPVQGGFAYAVSLGSEQLAAGDVPDPGVRRGVVAPDRPERGHAIFGAPTSEFTARVPIGKVSLDTIRDLDISLYQLDSTQPTPLRSDEPLRARVGRLAEEVTVLRGIRLEQLPQEVRVRLERALR
jgi:hypothetical protein